MLKKDCEDYHASPGITNHKKYSAALFGRSESCGSEGSVFFADMTLDLSLAKLEATPRTDKLFASMVAENPGRAIGGGVVRKGADTAKGGNYHDGDDDDGDLLGNLPPMPIIGDTLILPMEDGSLVGISSGSKSGGLNDDQLHGNDNQYDRDEHDEEANRSHINITSPLHFSAGALDSNSTNFATIISKNNSTHNLRPSPRRPPRRPRDVSYAILALMVLPIGLLLPHLYYPNEYIIRHNEEGNSSNINTTSQYSWSQMAMSSTSHTILLFSTLIATLISLLITRLLYNHPPGGGGNDKRYTYIGRTVLSSSHLCSWLYPTIAVYIWIMLPNVRRSWGMVLPLGMMVRDACFRMISPPPSLRTQHSDGGRRISSSSSHADRRTFFLELAVAALDIVSRSLRRKSFVRAISILLIIQFVLVSLWWGALSVVLSVKMYEDDAIISKFLHFLWLLITLISGKWATEIIIRLLGYVTSGGVASWFESQTTLIMGRMRIEEETRSENEERPKRRNWKKPPQSTPTNVLESISEDGDVTTDDCKTPDNAFSGDDIHRDDFGGNYSMPEAYREADASAYAPVVDFDEDFVHHDDEGDEDDSFSDENEEQREKYFPTQTSTPFQRNSLSSASSSSTVKSFLKVGCTISFGSVAQCGLLGGAAQMLWSFVRNINAMGFFLRRIHPQSKKSLRGFRGMEISNDSNNIMTHPWQWKLTMADWWEKMDDAIRCFVRRHSDLAMSHVAIYYKSYQMAARDVAALIESSGTLYIECTLYREEFFLINIISCNSDAQEWNQ